MQSKSFQSNLWAQQYEPFLEIDKIKNSMEIKGQTLNRLEKEHYEIATKRIEDELNHVYIATKRVCEISQTIILSAWTHALKEYANKNQFIERCYQKELEIEPYVPFFITGPSGTGKSGMINALHRMIHKPSIIKIDSNHGNFPLNGSLKLKVNEKKSVNQLLISLTNPDLQSGKLKITNKELVPAAKKWLYLTGCCLLLVDELQFLSQSEKSNTLLAQSILGMSYTSVPMAIIANYSLGHKLLRRPQEERQRILTNPIILLPDEPESEDWNKLIDEYQHVLQYAFAFNLKDKSKELWRYTAGLKRVLKKLLCKSYRNARKRGVLLCSLTDVEKTYLSSEFYIDREDVELLILNGVTGNGIRKDLISPFPIPKNESEKYERALSEARISRVTNSYIDSALSVAERKVLKNIEEEQNQNLPIIKKSLKNKTDELSIENLESNLKKFRDSKGQ